MSFMLGVAILLSLIDGSIHPSMIGFCRHGFPQVLGRRCGYPPAVHGFRASCPDFWLMLGFICDVVDVTGVLGYVSIGIFEIAKNIITRSVTSRAPCRLNAVFPQIRNTL